MVSHELAAALVAPIRLLPATVVDQIAAGEVIERPASVVRELLDNALDAGSTQVEIALESEARCLRVSDDGHGMLPAQARLAFERHATSKLRQVDDLLRVQTFGFRGEGLTSIAAVAEVLLRTRSRQAEQGVELEVRGGRLLAERPAGVRAGTSVEVRRLFFNTPARRKFQKSAATETAHVVDVVERSALAVCSVAFRLLVAGRLQLELPAVSERRERVRTLLRLPGAELLTVRSEFDHQLSVEAHLARPPRTLTTPRSLTFLVNGRPVRDRTLLTAVLRGLDGRVEAGRYPVGVVYVDVDPAALDVNVHPQKSEVRFAQPQRVFAAVRQAAGRVLGAPLPSEAAVPALPAPARVYRLGGTPGAAAADGAPTYLQQRARIAEATRRFFEAPDAEDFGLGAALAAAEGTAARSAPTVRIVGRTAQGLLICEEGGALWIVDERAAMHTITARTLQERIDAGVSLASRELPRALALAESYTALVPPRAALLARLGFVVEPFGRGAWLLRGVPSWPQGEEGEEGEEGERDEAAAADGQDWLALLDELLAASTDGLTLEAALQHGVVRIATLLAPPPELDGIVRCWSRLAARAAPLKVGGDVSPVLCLSSDTLRVWMEGRR